LSYLIEKALNLGFFRGLDNLLGVKNCLTTRCDLEPLVCGCCLVQTPLKCSRQITHSHGLLFLLSGSILHE